MLKVVADNEKPEKPKSKLRMATNVSRYCPFCGSNTWIHANVGNADVIKGIKPVKVRCCIHCLAKGHVITW